MSSGLHVAVIGLSITSSWGNGHATTYRALLGALGERGHDIVFFEQDVPWYAANRDAHQHRGYRVELYASLADLRARFARVIREADAVIVGSYVQDGAALSRWVTETASGKTLFYDIDTPVTLAKLASGDEEYVSLDALPSFDAYLSFTGGPTLAVLEQEFGVRLALPLYCSVDPSRHAPAAVWKRYDLGYLGTYSADRQPALDRLLLEPARRHPAGRFAVAGSGYPAGACWPANVERIDHVPPGAHPQFYCAQRFTLNVTRQDMVRMGYSPSVRLFEAAACGVPIISDRWPGIERFFTPDSEILLAEDTHQVAAYLRDLDEAERVQIGRRARARVLGQHTSRHRAAELESYVVELCAGRGRELRSSRVFDVPRTTSDGTGRKLWATHGT